MPSPASSATAHLPPAAPPFHPDPRLWGGGLPGSPGLCAAGRGLVPGPMPLKASALSSLGAVLRPPDGEGGQEALQSDDTPCPIRLAEALRAKVGLEGKELRPSDVHHCSPLARLHPFQVGTLRPRPRADQLPIALGRLELEEEVEEGFTAIPGSPSQMQNKTKQNKAGV